MNTVADTNCYGCKGTASIIGFGASGRECACVAHCEVCDGAIAWSHDDEKAPLLCAACECPSTKRSIFCEGLATWLVWASYESAEDETSEYVYVDAYSEAEAAAVVRGWSMGFSRAGVAVWSAGRRLAPMVLGAARRLYERTFPRTGGSL